MLVAHDHDALVLVEQEAHAHLTGDLAVHVRPAGGNQAAFVAAARVHDNGWREADRVPTVDHEGWPRTFTTVDDATYEAVWRRGIARAAEVDPLVGLLVGLHGARFFGHRRSPGMQALLAEERARQARVLDELGVGGTPDALPPEVAAMSDWIALLDALSLMLCGALPRPITAAADGVSYELQPFERGEPAVQVRPWPFHGPLPALTVTMRRLADQRCADDADLQERIVAAQPQTATVRVV